MNKYSLNQADLQKIGKGALIAVLGAFLTYLTQVVSQTNFGTYTPLVVAFFGIAVNAAWKVLDGKLGEQ